MSDERRQHNDPHPSGHGAPEQEGQRGHKGAEHGELTDLDSYVEGEQRYQQVRPGELQLTFEGGREAKAVNEAEDPGDDPAPAKVGAHDILERHVDNRYGDCRFYERSKPGAYRGEVIRGPNQRYRMPNSEGGDHRDETSDPPKRDDQAEQKQKMVGAAQNMFDAEPDEPDRRLVPRRVKGHATGPASDHHRPTSAAERHIPNTKLGEIPEVGRDLGLYRENGFWRGNRVDEMRVQITQLIGDLGIRLYGLGHVRDRSIIVVERAIRQRSQLARGMRRRETGTVFPNPDIAGQSPHRCVDGRP